MEYLFTERAHLMCPNMNFGIVETVNKAYDEELIKESIDVLVKAHPFLSALLGYEEKKNAYFYNVTDSSKVELILSGKEIDSDQEMISEFRKMVGRDWNLFEEGMLKIAAFRKDKKTVFILAFHHLLADGRGALELAEELADHYVKGVVPSFAEEKLISSIEDMPANSRLPFISKSLVNKANKDWAKENQKLSYEEYHRFAEEFVKKDKLKYSVKKLSKDELKDVHSRCQKKSVSINDYLMAKMFKEDDADKVIMACDLRKNLRFYNKGALGNYATAFGIEVKKKKYDILTLAEKIHFQVQKKIRRPSDLYLVLQCYAELNPGLLDAAFMAARNGFSSKAASFIGKMFFGFGESSGYCITNLGKISNDNIETAFFIPPASPAIRKTEGVLTVNKRMTICTCER